MYKLAFEKTERSNITTNPAVRMIAFQREFHHLTGEYNPEGYFMVIDICEVDAKSTPNEMMAMYLDFIARKDIRGVDDNIEEVVFVFNDTRVTIDTSVTKDLTLRDKLVTALVKKMFS